MLRSFEGYILKTRPVQLRDEERHAMNSHMRIDHVFVALSALAMRRGKFFRSDTLSAPLADLIASMQVDSVSIAGAGPQEVAVRGPIMGLDSAFLVAKWRGPEWPCLIYHHGNNESPFDLGPLAVHSFKNVIMRHQTMFPANIIAIRAPFHRSFRCYLDRIARLENFAAMLAASTVLAESLIQALRAQGCPQVLLCGTSLGGFVTNLHRTCFDTADFYAPIMAGAALDEIFISSAFRKLVSPVCAENTSDLRKVLNFESAFAARTRPNQHALLMRHDAIVTFDRQGGCFPAGSLSVLDRGHTTGAFETTAMRNFLLDCLQRSRASETDKGM